uniref:HlyD family efflux transporter periplasmic adaptor subunit n=1 Tax=Synechococcus sp. UW106 TaxID=368495 RepID=UPI000E0EF6F5|nr:HlyD family efflux transporter periplasmic adaptor subunit [Synechococcus sp. UW106]
MKNITPTSSENNQSFKPLGRDTTPTTTELLKPSRSWLQATIWTMLATGVFGIAWLAIAKTDEVVVATGKLEPLASVKDIQMPAGGVVKNILVTEGQEVKAGEVLLELDTEADLDRRVSLEETIELKRKELSLKQEERKQYLDLNSTEQEVLRENLVLQKNLMARYRKLSEQGASSEIQLLQQVDRVQQVEGQLEKIEVERERQLALIDQQLQTLKSELSRLRTDHISQIVKLRYKEIRSPVNGLVFDMKPTSKGFVANGTEPVMTIVPIDILEARVEVPSNKIGFIHNGQSTDLSIDSYRATDFGVLEGVVRKIGSDALEPDPSKGIPGYRFPVDIKLKSQSLVLKDGQSLPLQVGMTLTANIKLRKVSYLQLLIGGLRDKSESLREF